jgi:hypothetical protein
MGSYRCSTRRSTRTTELTFASVAARRAACRDGTRIAANEPRFDLMKSRIVTYVLRAAVCVAAVAAMSGCANLNPQPNGPGDCVGPPDFCQPFFGS